MREYVGAEGEGAVGGPVICACRGGAVLGGVLHGDDASAGAGADYGEDGGGAGLGFGEGGADELEGGRVVDDGEDGTGDDPEGGTAARIAEGELDSFVSFGEAVGEDGNQNSLAHFIGGEDEGAGHRRVILVRRGGEVHGVEIHGDAAGGAAGAGDGDGGQATGFAAAVGGEAELDGAAHVVVDDGEFGGAARAERCAAGRLAQAEVHSFVSFGEAVVEEGNQNGLAHFIDGEVDRAGHRRVIRARRGGAVLGLEADADAAGRTAGAGDDDAGGGAGLGVGVGTGAELDDAAQVIVQDGHDGLGVAAEGHV